LKPSNKTIRILMERQIIISEEELELLTEAVELLENKLRGNARRTMHGYGTVASATKRENYLYKAEMLRALISKIANEFI